MPGLLDVPGVTPDVAGSFFDAAATFFEQAPWKKAGERPIRISTRQVRKWTMVCRAHGARRYDTGPRAL